MVTTHQTPIHSVPAPHLDTALSDPILDLERCIIDSRRGCSTNRFSAYGVIAGLALLTAGQELEKSEGRIAAAVA